MLKAALNERQVSGELNCDTLDVSFTCQNKVHHLFSQFLSVEHGRKKYEREFNLDTLRFIGWRPYLPRSIQVFGDKLSCKIALQKNGFHVPGYALKPDLNLDPVLIKPNVSSFGENIKGPFKLTDTNALKLKEGEFFEQFIIGAIAKIYFWKEKPICAEIQKMPQVIGDGKSTIQELLSFYYKPRDEKSCWQNLQQVLCYFGYSLGTVLEKDKSK
jgi:hypothetical protein